MLKQLFAFSDSLQSLLERSYRRTSLAHYATNPPSPQAVEVTSVEIDPHHPNGPTLLLTAVKGPR